MTQQKKVVVKRIVSEDGKLIAEARSVVITSDENSSHIQQSVAVEVSANSCFSRSNSISVATTTNS